VFLSPLQQVLGTVFKFREVDNPPTWNNFVSCQDAMRPDSLEGFSAFVAVVEEGGFAAAARRLGLTTSAVSKQVGKLEARLKARLLLRTTRRLSLTEAGEVFQAHARRALAEAAAGHEAVVLLGAAPRGALRLAAPMSFGVGHIATAIAPFLLAYPDVSVDMVLDDRVQDLVAGGFDLAIRIGRLGDSGSVVARRLAVTSGVLCASPAYAARRGLPRAPADLRAHDTLLYSYGADANEWRMDGPAGPASIDITPRLRSNNSLALRAAALAGAGVLRVPAFVVGDDLAAGRLLPVLPDWRLPMLGIHAVFPDRAYVPIKARVFVEFLQARFGDPPYWERGARGREQG
jgi:DNA-binding transcriptional LysR family regulator